LARTANRKLPPTLSGTTSSMSSERGQHHRMPAADEE
jgi:hypothetical protein